MALKGGLQPTKPDNRDFQVGALFTLPKVSELPADFEIEGDYIKNQESTTKNSDYCSAYAIDGISEPQEGEEMWSEWGFAASKEMTGDPDSWGMDIRTALRRTVEYGSVPVKYKKRVKNPRLFSDYPEKLKEKALKHKKQTYLLVKKSGMDYFDAIRATMYRFKEEKRGVAIGVQFSWDLSDVFFETVGEGFGHAMRICGWKTINGVIYLKVANSYGTKAGENGYHYMSRKVANYYANIYGAYTLVDMPRGNAEYMLENGIKVEDNWLLAFVKVIKTIIFSPIFTNAEKDVLMDKANEIIESKVEVVKKNDMQPITPREELYNLAKSWLGKDASPKNFAPSDLACAESVSTLISLVTPFPIITGTWSLMAHLNYSSKFEKISTSALQKGDILLYASGTVKGAKFPGHVFIVGETHLMSNNSKNGLWDAYYTLATAKERWEKAGFAPHCYRLK